MVGPNVPLTHPRRCRPIKGRWQLFCSFFYLITGSERQHAQVRQAIVNHLRLVEHWMLPHFSARYLSATAYIEGTRMDRNRTWGSDVEISTLAHMLSTRVCVYVYVYVCMYVYDPRYRTWDRYGPHNADRTLSSDITHVYLHLTPT